MSDSHYKLITRPDTTELLLSNVQLFKDGILLDTSSVEMTVASYKLRVNWIDSIPVGVLMWSGTGYDTVLEREFVATDQALESAQLDFKLLSASYKLWGVLGDWTTPQLHLLASTNYISSLHTLELVIEKDKSTITITIVE